MDSYPPSSGEITLPFLHLGQSQAIPVVHQWRHLRDLVEFIALDEATCCTLANPLPNDSVLLLANDTLISA
jgi:hypothetical protein